MWDAIKGLILGIIQGLTEFLPVSSSGHLVIFQDILGMENAGVTFELFLHLATFISVVAFYFKDVIALIKELFALIRDIFSFGKRRIMNDERPYRRLLIMIIFTSVPVAVVGLILEDIIDSLFSSLLVVGLALMLTALFLTLSCRMKRGARGERDMTVKDALTVGLFQALALIPGLSRSGSTITGARIRGFNMEYAVRYSFLCSLPAIFGALLLKAKDLFEVASLSVSPQYITGFVSACIVGFLSLKLLTYMSKKNNLIPFAVYCLVAGVFSVVWYFVGA